MVLEKTTLRRQDQKRGKGKTLWLGPYVIRGVTKSGTYLLSTTEGIILKSAINRVNLKEWKCDPTTKRQKID